MAMLTPFLTLFAFTLLSSPPAAVEGEEVMLSTFMSAAWADLLLRRPYRLERNAKTQRERERERLRRKNMQKLEREREREREALVWTDGGALLSPLLLPPLSKSVKSGRGEEGGRRRRRRRRTPLRKKGGGKKTEVKTAEEEEGDGDLCVERVRVLCNAECSRSRGPPSKAAVPRGRAAAAGGGRPRRNNGLGKRRNARGGGGGASENYASTELRRTDGLRSRFEREKTHSIYIGIKKKVRRAADIRV